MLARHGSDVRRRRSESSKLSLAIWRPGLRARTTVEPPLPYTKYRGLDGRLTQLICCWFARPCIAHGASKPRALDCRGAPGARLPVRQEPRQPFGRAVLGILSEPPRTCSTHAVPANSYNDASMSNIRLTSPSERRNASTASSDTWRTRSQRMHSPTHKLRSGRRPHPSPLDLPRPSWRKSAIIS